MLLRWLEQEQQRDTCWHRTKTLASSPYNYVFLGQPWTRDGIAIPASRSRSQDLGPPTTGPRMHHCLKPGHDSTSVDSITSGGGQMGVPGPPGAPQTSLSCLQAPAYAVPSLWTAPGLPCLANSCASPRALGCYPSLLDRASVVPP